MIGTHIKQIEQRMLCVTIVYLRDITNTSFVILHLNVSQLSIYTLLIYFIIAVIYLFLAFFCSVTSTHTKKDHMCNHRGYIDCLYMKEGKNMHARECVCACVCVCFVRACLCMSVCVCRLYTQIKWI